MNIYISLLTEVSQAARKWERGERPLPAPDKFFDVPSSAIWDETKPVLKYRFFVTLVTHLLRMSRFIDYWNHCEPTFRAKTGLPRLRFTWLKCHSLPWDAGACSIGILPGAGRGLSPLSHFLAASETSVSREYIYISYACYYCYSYYYLHYYCGCDYDYLYDRGGGGATPWGVCSRCTLK